MASTRLLPTRLAAVIVGMCAAASALAAPCESTAHRQFDFWIGEWEVRTPDGKLAGRNRIERVQDGCALHESYTTGRGFSGESLNTYDASRKLWHQTWVDNSGALLLLEGGLEGESMVLAAQTVDAGGAVTRHRITWTPGGDGSVRQHWESTNAEGQWATAFDGKYTRQ